MPEPHFQQEKSFAASISVVGVAKMASLRMRMKLSLHPYARRAVKVPTWGTSCQVDLEIWYLEVGFGQLVEIEFPRQVVRGPCHPKPITRLHVALLTKIINLC